MKRLIKILMCTMLFLLMYSGMTVYGAHLETTTEVNGRNVIISGQIVYENSTSTQNEVALQICFENEKVYANQTISDYDGSFTFNAVLPENAQSGTYTYQIGTDTNTGIYTREFEYVSAINEIVEYVVSGSANDEVKLIASGSNISDFTDRIFTLTYDSTQIEALNLWGEYIENDVGTGRKGNVEVVSYTPGEIIFKIVEKEIPDGKVWSGVLNIFKFKFASNYSGTSTVTIQ